MGIIKSIGEWEVEVGENIGGYIPDILKDSAGFLCDIRAKYPSSFFDRSFGRGLANAICRTVDKPPAPLPQVPFSGGQCFAPYNVFVIFGNPGTAEAVEFGVFVQRGAVTSIVGDFETLSGSGSNTRHLARITVEARDTNNAPQTYYNEGIIVGEPLQPVGGNRLEPINHADDCGDPPASLPPDPERDPDDFRKTVQICDRDEEGSDINCEDVEIVLPEKDSYDFPVCVLVDSKKICLDADGWSIEDAPEKDKEEEEEEPEEEFEEEEILKWVLVQVVEIKPTAKRIQRPDAKDSEIFAGYIAFAYTDGGVQYWQPAIPIRKERNAFRVAEDSQIYSVYTNYDYQVNIKEIKETIKIPIEQPSEE